jgi:LysM repeat protein
VKGKTQSYATYIVGKGKYENLWRISRKFGATVEELARVNRIKGNIIKTGQVLKIPKERARPETLERVAERLGIGLEELKNINPAIRSGRAPLPPGYKVRIWLD